MSLQLISEIEFPGFEKSCCLHGNWVTICHAAHLTGDQSLVANNIQYVIPQLLKRHPRFRSRINIEEYRHTLQILNFDEKQSNINLFYSIVEMNNQSWQKIVEDRCNRNPFLDNGKTMYPLFHFMLLLNDKSSLSNDDLFHVLLFSNHAVADGRSGYILMNDFLTLVTSSDLREREEPVNTEVVPCLTHLIPCSYGPIFRLETWIKQRLYQHELCKLNHPRIPIKTTRIGDQSTPFLFQPIKNNFLFTSSSSTLYTRLHEKCRSQNVTINAPLTGCLLLAVHHCFPSKKKHSGSLIPFATEIAVDMRSRFSHSSLTPQTIGCCVSVTEIQLKKKLPISSTSFWSLAKKCMKITNDALASPDLRTDLNFYDYILKNERKFLELCQYFPNGLMAELCLSNLGKYPYSCNYQNQVQLRGLHLINNMSVHYVAATVFVTCAGDGQLDFSLSHVIESEEKAQEFLNLFVRLVESSADADHEITLEQLLVSAKEK